MKDAWRVFTLKLLFRIIKKNVVKTGILRMRSVKDMSCGFQGTRKWSSKMSLRLNTPKRNPVQWI